MKRSNYLRSAAVISLGGIFAKGIGVLYRIPLTSLLGGYGMGLYQMAYPLFCVLLTFSSAGIPSAFSRTIAREEATGGNGGTLKTALKLFALLGACGTAIFCLLAPAMSRAQGSGELLRCYFALAPSVFLVALIAVFRGYFQGKNNMVPTALSEIVEQLFKAGLGLFFAYRYRENTPLAVASCLFAVTLSEAAALLCLYVRSLSEPKRRMLPACRVSGTEILFSALPVMAATSLLPLSQTLDSVVLVRLLGGSSQNAVALYGLFAGCALSLVSLPATASYGLAAAAVPAVARSFARGEEEAGTVKAMQALLLTLLFSLPCAAGLFFLARPIVSLLYGGLAPAETETLVLLVKTMSVSAAALAGVDTLAACLTGMGRAKKAAFSMLCAVVLKLLLQLALVGDPRFSVGGAAIAANACYLLAFFLDLYYTMKQKRGEKRDHDHRVGNKTGRRFGAGNRRHEGGTKSARAEYVARRGEFEG